MAKDVATKEASTQDRYEELYQQLNAEQRAAVDAIEGPVMVLAGPGTGKTQVLAMRIATILQRTQMDPWNILCLTFTESAAATMRQRLISIVGEAAYYVTISTFHSFCNDVIQEHPELFAQSTQWQVLSDVERIGVLRSLLDELSGTSPLKPFGHPYVYLADVVQNLQWLKKEGVTPDGLKKLLAENKRFVARAEGVVSDFLVLKHTERTDEDCEKLRDALAAVAEKEGLTKTVWPQFAVLFDRYGEAAEQAEGKREQGKVRTRLKNEVKKLYERMARQLPRQRELLKVYRGYQDRLREIGRYDYEDMIMQVLERFKDDDELLAQYQEQYQYILVDEYQDTNGAQNEVVRLLGSFYPNPNVFVVGDDKQSIFRFQGASLENLLSFYERHREDVTVISLAQNYRSQQTVLNAAGAVINHNTALMARHIPGLTTELTATRGVPAPLGEYVFAAEDEENYFVAVKIKELIESGVDPSEIAVLYRFNRDASSLLDVLLRMDVPVHVSAGDDVLRDRRVQQLLQLLQYVADEQQDDVLADVLQYDCWGLDPLSTLKVIHLAGTDRVPLLSVITDVERLREAGATDSETFKGVAQRLASWRRLAVNDTLQRLFDVVLQESGLLERILADPDRLVELHRMTTLFNELQRLNQADAHLTVQDFVARLQLLQEHGLSLTTEGWQTKSSAVQLMTAHRAKGLEFEQVFLIRLVDKHWGNVRERARLTLPLGVVHHDPIAGTQMNEDERRLFYVALTRAKDQLYLSRAQRGMGNREQVASLFVREIPEELRREVETTETEDEALSRLSTVRLSVPRSIVGPDVREWLSEQLKTYVMSVTHLNNYLECPRLFYYRNLLRVPAAKTKHMAFGTAVHNALRDVFVRLNEASHVPTADYLVEQFNYYLGREILSDTDQADSLALGEQVLKGYYDQYAASFAGETLLEYDFRPHGVHLDDLSLTGKLDKVEVVDVEKKLVNVVDYKTGNPDNGGAHWRENGKYRRQLVFYKLLSELSPRFDYEMVSAELDFVQPSARTGKYVKKKFEVSSDDVEKLKDTIREVWGEIQALSFLEAEGCGNCQYCKRL